MLLECICGDNTKMLNNGWQLKKIDNKTIFLSVNYDFASKFPRLIFNNSAAIFFKKATSKKTSSEGPTKQKKLLPKKLLKKLFLKGRS